MNENKYVLVFPNKDSIQINITQDINRPNQPDDYEIIADYVEDNYGITIFEIVELESIEVINILK